MTKLSKYLLFLVAFWAAPMGCAWGQVRIDSFPGLEWYKVLAGYDQYDQVKDMEQCPDGSIYYAGVYNSALFVGTPYYPDTLFQDTVIMNSGTHGYVVKLDSSGNFQWVWIITGGGNSASAITDISIAQNGDLWVTGWHVGEVQIPFGGSFDNALDGDGFAICLKPNGNGSNFVRMWGNASQFPKMIVPNQNGTLCILLDRPQFPTYIANDTISSPGTAEPFLGSVTIDTLGNLLDFGVLGLIANGSHAGFHEATMDWFGNLYLHASLYGNVASDSGKISFVDEDIFINGDFLTKINPNHEVEWIQPTSSIVSNQVIRLDASSKGELYLAADAYSTDEGHSFITKYSAAGKPLWKIENSGYQVFTGGIAVCNDYLYWSGRYRCDMTIDTIHFKIGDRQPWPSQAETGYLCVINKHTGKIVSVLSDASSDQIKGFGRIVANEGRNLTVEANIRSTLCIIDTLTLQLTSADIPYKLLVRLEGIELPQWPEDQDTLPNVSPDFAMWPNPTNGEFTIQTTDLWSSKSKVEIFSCLGQKIWSNRLQRPQTQIDLKGMVVGDEVLLVRIFDPDRHLEVTKRVLLMN